MSHAKGDSIAVSLLGPDEKAVRAEEMNPDMFTFGDIAAEFVVGPRQGFGEQEYEGRRLGSRLKVQKPLKKINAAINMNDKHLKVGGT